MNLAERHRYDRDSEARSCDRAVQKGDLSDGERDAFLDGYDAGWSALLFAMREIVRDA